MVGVAALLVSSVPYQRRHITYMYRGLASRQRADDRDDVGVIQLPHSIMKVVRTSPAHGAGMLSAVSLKQEHC